MQNAKRRRAHPNICGLTQKRNAWLPDVRRLLANRSKLSWSGWRASLKNLALRYLVFLAEITFRNGFRALGIKQADGDAADLLEWVDVLVIERCLTSQEKRLLHFRPDNVRLDWG